MSGKDHINKVDYLVQQGRIEYCYFSGIPSNNTTGKYDFSHIQVVAKETEDADETVSLNTGE
jgi:hypothetical protein